MITGSVEPPCNESPKTSCPKPLTTNGDPISLDLSSVRQSMAKGALPFGKLRPAAINRKQLLPMGNEAHLNLKAFKARL